MSSVLSLGFRGEALASIAAVSRVELITKTSDSLTGSRYRIEGGAEAGLEEVGVPEGTTLLVRDLFYNTPARKKFLKQPATEGGYVQDFVEKIALSRPDISIRYLKGGSSVLHTSGNHNLKDIIYQIFRQRTDGESHSGRSNPGAGTDFRIYLQTHCGPFQPNLRDLFY